MEINNANKLQELSRNSGVDISNLVTLYSIKQTEYLKRDLTTGIPVNDYMHMNHYGERFVNTMTKAFERKGSEWVRDYVTNKIKGYYDLR